MTEHENPRAESADPPSWKVVQEVIGELVDERRRDRRQRNMRFIITSIIFGVPALLYLAMSLWLGGTGQAFADKDYVALVRLEGTIAPGEKTSAARVIPVLEKAFEDENAKAVLLVINSPGGSPVQASLIHQRMMELKQETGKPLIAIAEDTVASGAYWVAMAADELVVNASTVTGSIGVIMQSMGVEELLDRLGVEPRVFTAGENKARLSPFAALKGSDRKKAQAVLDATHQEFIRVVKEGRGERLKGDPVEVFSGDFWTGAQAIELGLADRLGSVHTVMRDFGVKHYREYTAHATLSDLLPAPLRSVLSFLLGIDLRSPVSATLY